MKRDRKGEIIACCEGIARNAEKIAQELEHNSGIEITIKIDLIEAPVVCVSKTFVPKELCELWQCVDGVVV